MAWSTPKTWTASTLTVSDMNAHVRDNLDAVRTASKTTTATATANVGFSAGSEATVVSTTFTFNSAGTYLIEGSIYAWTAQDTTPYTTDLLIRVNGNQVGAARDRNVGTSAVGRGMNARALVSGLSGSLSVTLKIYSGDGGSHTANCAATYPAILTITPVDVV